MKNSRKFQCKIYQWFYKLSNNKYYICDECHKIHKTDNNKLVINNELCIFVHNICYKKLQNYAVKLLHDTIFKIR